MARKPNKYDEVKGWWPECSLETATPAELRHEAEGLDDAASANIWALDRGHLDSEQAVWALRLYSGLRERSADLKRRARLREARPISTVPA
jgi:hypothetical protein